MQMEERFYINIPVNVPPRVWQGVTNDESPWRWKHTITPMQNGLFIFLLTNDEV